MTNHHRGEDKYKVGDYVYIEQSQAWFWKKKEFFYEFLITWPNEAGKWEYGIWETLNENCLKTRTLKCYNSNHVKKSPKARSSGNTPYWWNHENCPSFVQKNWNPKNKKCDFQSKMFFSTKFKEMLQQKLSHFTGGEIFQILWPIWRINMLMI